MSSILPPSQVPASGPGDPAWELALLYPVQGQWSDTEYLSLTDGINRYVELTEGRLEVLQMPKSSHQRIMLFLWSQLQAFILTSSAGQALCAPLRVRIAKGSFREPDVVFMLESNQERAGEDFWEGADLVMEVVSPDDDSRKRDLEEKPVDYAKAGIPEYWIVDPQQKQITVLTLAGEEYDTSGVYAEGETAVSRLLPEFSVIVAEVFAAGKK